MGKKSTRFVCQSCGAVFPRWAGRCESCGEWNAIVEEETALSAAPNATGGKGGRRIEFVGLQGRSETSFRLKSGIQELDRVCGGGLVSGSVLLIGGDPGIGKSTLLAMMARHTQLDVTVLGLIGERGREAREFIEDDLGQDGMKRSVVVVATSDESPLMRRQAAYVAMTVAEYFRDLNKNVLCLMDSVTRFAMAQREISLSAGEPPATKGYTPTVFAELPRLLERAGPGLVDSGSITGLFTVLVDGDDHNEPIADAVRGILDGHIVLERSIAERNRYPAINLLRSISRTMPACNNDAENALVARARTLIATYENMAELIRLGAYKPGSDPQVDEAIFFYDKLEKFLSQKKQDKVDFATGYKELNNILSQSPQRAHGAR